MRLPVLILATLLAAGPALAQGRPDPHKAELDQLFAALKAAPDEQTAATVEAHIHETWIAAGSPAVLLLLNRGNQDIASGDTNGALDTLDDALVLEPDFPEAWLERAVAKFHAGDYPGAVRDIEATLRLEPRQFLAFQALSQVAEAQQNWKGALEAWQKALAIDPHMPKGQERLQMLERKAYGEST